MSREPSAGHEPRSEDQGRLVRALFRASNDSECLRCWLEVVRPDSDLAALLGAGEHVPVEAFRREGEAWKPVALPPVPYGELPEVSSSLSLDRQRTSAMHDLLFSLSLQRVMILPLAAEMGGALLLARAGEPFGEGEIRRIDSDADLLASAVLHHRRERQAHQRSGSTAQELSALFEMTRALAQAVDVGETIDSAERTLDGLLAPTCGAISVGRFGDAGPVLRVWPEGDLAREAASVVGGGLKHAGLNWVVCPHGPQGVDIALAWRDVPPVGARRIAGSVQASLGMALERLESQRLREEDRLLRTVEGLPLGVVLVSGRGRIRLVNQEGKRLLESLDAWPGAGGRLLEIASVKLGPLIAEAVAGSSASAEVFFPQTGRTLAVRVVPAGVARSDQRGVGGDVVIVLEELTEIRRQKHQLAQAEKLSALGELIAGVVHELNNPLSTILGYSQMLLGMPESASRQQWMSTILEEGQRCHRIVGNMLSLARSHGGVGELVSLAAIAEKAFSLVSYPYRTMGIEASLRVDSETPAVRGDADGLLQVLINLLTNAMHALEETTGPKEVRVEIGPDGGEEVLLAVSDSGPGIPAELREQIFEPFFTTKQEGKGTGLGLSQVAATIRDHGGRVAVHEARGGGAQFRIHLPCVPEERPAEAPEEQVVLPAPNALRDVRVLVVDDEASVADCLAEFLRHAGARVELAGDGAQGFEKLLAEPFDVVVCDLRMPRMGGEELLARVRERAPRLLPRLVFSSGDIEALDAKSLVKELGRPCLPKPFDFREVLETVKRVHRSVEGSSFGRSSKPTGLGGPAPDSL